MTNLAETRLRKDPDLVNLGCGLLVVGYLLADPAGIS